VTATAVTAPQAAKKPSGFARTRRYRRAFVGVLALAVCLEIFTRLEIVNSAFLPPLSRVLVGVGTLLGRADFREAVLWTIGMWALSLGIVTVIGVILGIAFGLSDFAYRVTRSLIELVRPVPPVALIPLLLLAFGRGPQTALFVAAFGSVWPVLFNTITGVHDVNSQAKEMARSFRFSGTSIVRLVIFPSAAPFIVTGIRLASSICLISVVTVSLIAGGRGIGYFIVAMQQAGGSNVAFVYAAIVLTGVLGLLLNAVIEFFERRFFGWQFQIGES
jgi:NitT/TauT family transport system permease protein